MGNSHEVLDVEGSRGLLSHILYRSVVPVHSHVPRLVHSHSKNVEFSSLRHQSNLFLFWVTKQCKTNEQIQRNFFLNNRTVWKNREMFLKHWLQLFCQEKTCIRIGSGFSWIRIWVALLDTDPYLVKELDRDPYQYCQSAASRSVYRIYGSATLIACGIKLFHNRRQRFQKASVKWGDVVPNWYRY